MPVFCCSYGKLTLDKSSQEYTCSKAFSELLSGFWESFIFAKFFKCVNACRLTQTSHIWKKRSSNKVLPLSSWPEGRQVCGGISLINDWCKMVLPTVDSASPGKVILGCTRNPAEQAIENKTIRNTPLWPLLQFLPPDPALSFWPDFICDRL